MSISRETYNIASRAIGAELLPPTHPPEQLAGLVADEATGLFPVQSDMYVTALQGVARYMRQNQAQSTEPLSRKERLPSDGQYAVLRDELQPARHRLHMITGVAKLIERDDASADQTLRPSQRTLFGGLSDFLAKRSTDPGHPYHRKGYVKSTTGSGKNFVIAKFAEAIKDEAPAMPKVLILVPGKSDIKQVLGRSDRNGFAKHAPNVKATEWSSVTKDLSGDVVVATYAGFVRGYENGIFKSEDYGAVLCDEVHKAIGVKTQESIDDFSKDMVNIGFTATDAYSENHRVSNYYEERIYSMTLRESVERGEVPPIQTLLYQTNTDITGEFKRTNDFSQDEFNKLIADTARNKQADDVAVSMVENGQALLVACAPGNKAQHAKDRAQALSDRQITDPITGKTRNMVAVAIHGEMRTKDRENAYERYEKGEIDVLTFVNVLNESFDSERASVLINLRPTTSPVIAEQRLGRILRGTNLATVIDFIDTSRRNQCLALHVLGENRYVMGRVFGQQEITNQKSDENTDQLPTFSLPAHIIASFKKLSDRHLGIITKDRKVEAIEYRKLTLTNAAIATGLSPLVLAIIGKELGAVEYEELQPDQKTPHKPFISEEHLPAIETAYASERYDILRQKSPEDLARIVEILYSSDKAFRMSKFTAAQQDYEDHARALAASQDITKRLGEVVSGASETMTDRDSALVKNLITVAKHMNSSDNLKAPYVQFLNYMLEVTSPGILKPLLPGLGIRNINTKHTTLEDGSYRVFMTAEVNGEAVSIQQTYAARTRLFSRAYAELVTRSLDPKGVSFATSEKESELKIARIPSSVSTETLSKLFLESGLISLSATKKKQDGEQLMHGSGANAAYESATNVCFRSGSRFNEIVTITGIGSASSLARQDKWDKIAAEVTDTYGSLTASFVVAAFGEQYASKTSQPNSAAPTPSEFKTGDAKLIKFMGTDDPEAYLTQLAIDHGVRPPKVKYETQGNGIIANVKVSDKHGSRGFVIGHAINTDQKKARKTALMAAVRMIKKVAEGEIEKDSPQAQKLLELGYAL